MNLFLRTLVMLLLVFPLQYLIRGILPGILGNGYELEILGFDSVTVVIILSILIVSSIYLFHITEPFYDEK
ncbi:hypothetical protein [Terrisporobacter sp.]